jgi:hypothetical protein
VSRIERVREEIGRGVRTRVVVSVCGD